MKSLAPYLAARSVEELWQYHTSHMAGFGFDRMLYAYTRFQGRNRLGDPEDAMVLTNHHPDYVEAYVGRGMFQSAPMINWAARNTGAISWRHIARDIQRNGASNGAREVLALNQRFGLVAGYTISFPMAARRSAAGIGLAARPELSQDDVDQIWAANGEQIEIINNVAHLAIMQLPATGQRRLLTPRQTEVLELVADGKSVQDIAYLLNRTPATIDKHLRGARDSLGVETTAQAVRKASVLNQIFVVDPGKTIEDWSAYLEEAFQR
ncbi:helix-turn-helix transcriptional regulator [Nioella nitratireducens]|uniref:helix-turn-helix transcriptional regulator n=1 Tax=Nioella nitratireducens TaxID=1287720 RepID=UPI001F39070C|nr:LuxR family transcriptional regulator [Nioella nitratireducens]